jgi:hypothetical protein
MKPALIFFCVLTSLSLWAGAQEKTPSVCRGKSLPITLLPGQEMTSIALPLRFGGTRDLPHPPFHTFPSKSALRRVIRNREKFSNYWQQLISPVPPGNWVPRMPEIDFSKEMVVVSAMGEKPSSGYFTLIDGACEVDGQVEVFVSNVDGISCGAQMAVPTYPADAVRLPRTDLPVVFRETQLGCTQWQKRLMQPK